MARQMDQMVNQRLNQQMLLQEAEFRALQQQINPHFIFNILQTMQMMAEVNDQTELADMIAKFGRMVRYNLYAAVNVPLSEELENVRDYLMLQKILYNDELEMTIDMESTALQPDVPRLILQPLVENAVLHGRIRGKILHVSLVGRETQDGFQISIFNDGALLSAQREQELQAVLEDVCRNPGSVDGCNAKNNLALINIQKRLLIRFGSSCRLAHYQYGRSNGSGGLYHSAGGEKGLKIMIVEDQKIILKGIEKMFRHFCQDEIFPFSDPAEACRKLSLLHPDVIFTDIVMEGLDGLTLLRSASKALPRCRFVIISGFANFEYARQAIDLKVDSYLLKPIERSALEEVYHKLREALQEPEPPARKLRISEEALRYIREHSAEKLSIASIAAQVHISPNYLSNIFRKETGASVNEVIRQEQMKAAARLLRDTDLYLYEISEQLGYKDVKYFSLLFRECYQMAPKAYRQKYRAEEERHD